LFNRLKELMKLKKKINEAVQILTHVKEKLKFVEAQNDKEKQRLAIHDEKVKKVISCLIFAMRYA
jgi:hypothetical protein